MSEFAEHVRARLSETGATRSGSRPGGDGSRQVGLGSRDLVPASELMVDLMQANSFCAEDPRCVKAHEALALAQTDADARTALTQLQVLLQNLTAEDADIAADERIQVFRRGLHVLLDHQ